MAARSRPLPRSVSLVSVLLLSLTACTARHPVDPTPQNVGRVVQVAFNEPRSVVASRTGSDSLLFVRVRSITGELAAMSGDTVLLRRVTRVETTDGVAVYWTEPEIAVRVVLQHAYAGLTERRVDTRTTATGVVLTVVALVAVIALLLAQDPIYSP